MQPHLKKIFDNIEDIKFNADTEIISMCDDAGETVMFKDRVNPLAKGVEYWMGDVEK